MRRLTLIAAVLAAAACSSSKDEGDKTPPAVPVITAPAAGAILGAAALVSGQVVFLGTAEAGATVEIQVDGAAAGSALASSGGGWTIPATVADGHRAVQARAIDAAGNASAFSAAVSITVDTIAPAAPVVAAPQDGAALVATDLVNGQVVFTGAAEAGATVELEVDGVPSGTGAADGGGAWSIAVALTSDAHTARARAIDAAANASAFSTPVAFTLDATRLALPIPAGSPVPVTSWGQSVRAVDGDPSGLGELFPGQANSWALAPDFSLAAGFGLEYANGLVLYTGTPTAPRSHGQLFEDVFTVPLLDAFPGDQRSSQAVFLTPLFGVQDGVVTAAAFGDLAPDVRVISGAQSAYLNGTSDSRLSRTLTLDPARTYRFGWTHQAVLQGGSLVGADAAPYAPSYQVVLRDPGTGAMIGAPLFSSTTHVLRATESATRSGLPGQVVLSFELRSAEPGYAQIDDVTLEDGSGPLALANGDFEAGLSDWQANDGAESQNVRSGARDVGTGASALRITRTFYAPPASPWGRLVDVFENTGATDVTTTAVYVTLLGGQAPLAAITQNGAAVVGWDGAATVRDVGIVSGTGTAYVADGSAFVFVTHDLTVPAGGKVALMHFVVQLGEAAGGPTSAAADVPAGTDAECAAILAGYPALEPYRTDFEPGVRALIRNF